MSASKLICPVCDREVPAFHPRSHVVPKWVLKKCFTSKDRAGLHVHFPDMHVKKIQDGAVAEIVCWDCETKAFAPDDEYAGIILGSTRPKSAILSSIVAIQIARTREYIAVQLSGIDALKFQRFVFSLIMRRHLALKANGKPKGLIAEHHFEKMKNIWRGSVQDFVSYPIMGLEVLGLDGGLVIEPTLDYQDGHHLVRYVGGKHAFHVYISSHRKPAFLDGIALSPAGTIVVLQIPWFHHGLITTRLPDLKKVNAAHHAKISKWF